jgi:hypothetical protein
MPPDTENVCFRGKIRSDLLTVKTALLTVRPEGADH